MPDRLTTAEPPAPFRDTLRLGLIYLALVIPLELASHWAIDWWASGPAFRSALRVGADLVLIFGTAGMILYLAYGELRKRQEVEERQQILLDQSLAGISLVQDDRFRFVNQRLAEILGYEVEELTDPSFEVLDIISPEGRSTAAEHLGRLLEGGEVHYRFPGLTRDGEEIRVEVYARRVEWDGEPAVLSIYLDVTENEILREQARRSQKMKALGELTGEVAHDFNNLLTTIIAPLDLCEDELAPNAPARRELQEARDGAARAKTLTRQLLSFSRQRVYRPWPTDLTELVENMEPLLRRLSGSGIDLRLDLAENLPAVEVDPSHFEQVILNLVTNARDAVDGRGEIRVATSVEPSEQASQPRVVLEVADDGRGMDEETRKQVFEPFFTTRDEGTGLGLSITHGIVTQVGGEISVDSRPGQGATFRIRLPGSEREAEPLGQHEESPEQAGDAVSTGGATVLVVEDQEPVRRVTTRILERHGFETLSARDGEEALTVIADHRGPIDLVLTDVGLPDTDGTKLVSEILDRSPDVKVSYMSGRSDEEVLGRMARESDRVFLEKPFSVQELLGAVRLAMQGERG